MRKFRIFPRPYALAAALALVARMDQKAIKTAQMVIVPSHRRSPLSNYRDMRDAIGAHPGRLKLMAAAPPGLAR